MKKGKKKSPDIEKLGVFYLGRLCDSSERGVSLQEKGKWSNVYLIVPRAGAQVHLNAIDL